MTTIIFAQFGMTTHLIAAEIIDGNGGIGAVILEPTARGAQGWDEVAFRAIVEADIAGWEARAAGEVITIQYDPGRDNATEVSITLRG